MLFIQQQSKRMPWFSILERMILKFFSKKYERVAICFGGFMPLHAYVYKQQSNRCLCNIDPKDLEKVKLERRERRERAEAFAQAIIYGGC